MSRYFEARMYRPRASMPWHQDVKLCKGSGTHAAHARDDDDDDNGVSATRRTKVKPQVICLKPLKTNG